MKVVWESQALAELDDIGAWISRDSPRAAARVVAQIRASTRLLELFPRAGREGRVEGTRELRVRRTPYLVIYTIDERQACVRILGVLHGARQRR